ncbi:MAG: glutathione S-transferase family protein [Myxococcales bacterium]|nr:glutathione S-transferase family protein [Myxococcales bacterium]MDH3482952.1 glutathione S-transferase family protein [Myxococcales bacterium]
MTEPDHKLTLYFHPRTRSTRPRWLLEELGVDYDVELVKLFEGAHKTSEYLTIHPLGRVPALRHGDDVMFESLGICLYLADRFPQAGLAPGITDLHRAEYCQWMAFSTSTLEPVLFAVLLDKGKDPERLKEAQRDFAAIVELFEATLRNRLFLLGEEFSAADVMNGAMMAWAYKSSLLTPGSGVEQWVQRITARPSYQRAHAD